jgi:8-oxo-dGTP diphosphatase
MKEFIDANGHKVQFLYEPNSFPEKARHVLVICKYKNQWLLTKHKKRGWEFPGGKVEIDETLEEAAFREVWEETGACIKELIDIGSYKVKDHSGVFVKKVFFGIVERLEINSNYLETTGPVLVPEDFLIEERFRSHYSFIMQDEMIEICLQEINEKQWMQST